MSKTARRIFVGMALLGVAMFAAGCLSNDEALEPLQDFWVEVQPYQGMNREAMQDLAEQAALEFEQFGILVDPSSPNVIKIRVVKDEVVGDFGGRAYFEDINNLAIHLPEKVLGYAPESIMVTLMHELGHMVTRTAEHLELPTRGVLSPVPLYVRGQGFSEDDKNFICNRVGTCTAVGIPPSAPTAPPVDPNAPTEDVACGGSPAYPYIGTWTLQLSAQDTCAAVSAQRTIQITCGPRRISLSGGVPPGWTSRTTWEAVSSGMHVTAEMTETATGATRTEDYTFNRDTVGTVTGTGTITVGACIEPITVTGAFYH